MKNVLLLAAALLATSIPAFAKDFVQDQAQMFSPDTVAQLNSRISNFNAQTGKEIVVVTVPSVTDGDVRTAAENAFSQQQVNGVLIFVDKGDRKDYILADRAAVQAGWWTSQTSQSIASAMQAQFKAGDFDGGITTAVNGALDVYRSHMGSLGGNQPAQAYGRHSFGYPQHAATSGVHIGVFWIIIMALVAFFIIRSLMRAAAGPRYPGGYGPGGAPGPGPGYGPGAGYGGYGSGYGWGGGGGGFFSGLLGGLGGAWLGNELFGHQNWGGGGGGAYGNVDPNAGGPPADAGGWQADPGQADVSGGGGGDWSGGGFGGGDFGGGFGGGGDFGGGGGGDAGGGW